VKKRELLARIEALEQENAALKERMENLAYLVDVLRRWVRDARNWSHPESSISWHGVWPNGPEPFIWQDTETACTQPPPWTLNGRIVC